MPAFTCCAADASPLQFARPGHCCPGRANSAWNLVPHQDWRKSRRLTVKRYCSLLLLLRRKNHDHLAAFHLRELLDLAVRLQIGFQTFQHTEANILMRHLTTAETQGDLGFIAVIKELDEITQLDIVVTIISPRTEFDFLHEDDLLLQFGFVSFLLLRVLKFAVVHQTAYRWLRCRRDFHQINVCLFRQAEGFGQTYDTEWLVIDPA